MKGILLGAISRPAVAMVGAWDPFTSDSRALMAQLSQHARQQNLDSLVVLIDPPPPVLIHGPFRWREFHDGRTRAEIILGCGIDAVLWVTFSRRDIDFRARTFLKFVQRYALLDTLWLGGRQSFGRGRDGSQDAILDVADELGFQVVILPEPRSILDVRQTIDDVQKLLAAGAIAQVTELIGMPPIKSRPPMDKLWLSWRPGLYHAVPLDHPTSPLANLPIPLELAPVPDELSCIDWPAESIPYLAFVSGPG